MDFNFTLNIEMIIKLLCSVLLGMLIGNERKKHDKSGGKRTVAIVCLGATLMGILNLELMSMAGLSELCRINIARIPSYTLVAMGFLGSGIITKTKQGIEGLTSASVLFSIVPIGIALGMGFYQLAGVTSVLLFLTLEMKYFKRR